MILSSKAIHMNIQLKSLQYPYRIMGIWLLILCSMVVIMVLLGGLARLTHSGLSMVDWRPITGWLPPLGQQEWSLIFELYKNTPEFKKINYGMNIDDFKGIFWLEYIHRLWGRIMGLSLVIPSFFFWAKGWLNFAIARHLVVIFLFGGLQGALGWWMVKSGLIDNPDVSQYRLTAHLLLAVTIHGYMFWLALTFLGLNGKILKNELIKFRFLYFLALSSCVGIFLMMFSGGFVAGLDAGMIYNTFPLMDGKIIPDGLWILKPWYLNFFENITMVQFNHRILGVTCSILIFATWLVAQKNRSSKLPRHPFNILLVLIILQVSLGVITLVMSVPVFWASFHQINALLLFTCALWCLRSVKV